MILLDTSVLIDFFRCKDKSKSLFAKISGQHTVLQVSVITEFEIFTGVKPEQRGFWEGLFQRLAVLPIDRETARQAALLDQQLKRNRMQIEMADLFIATTALQHGLPLATFNRKHFERVEGLELVLP